MASALRVVRILLWAGSALCLLASPAVRGAPTDPPIAALVRVAGPKDRQLFERVRGQMSDLRVRLSASETGPLEPTFAEQLALGRARATSAGAQLVVWFARHATRLEVVVADLRADRVLVRSIERGAQQLDKSAQEEAAALVVRSAVKASLLGEALGTPAAYAGNAEGERADQGAGAGGVDGQEQRSTEAGTARTGTTQSDRTSEAGAAPDEGEEGEERSDETAREQDGGGRREEHATPETSRPKESKNADEQAPHKDEGEAHARRSSASSAPDTSRAWLLALGGQGGFDGATAYGHYGLAARVGRARGRFEGGLRGGFGFKARVREQSAAADVHLARHRAAAYLAYVPVAGTSLRVALALDAGVHVLATEVRARQEGFQAEGRRALLPELGAELSLAYLPPGLGGRTGFAAVAGLESFPQRVVLGYREDARFVTVRGLLPVQPVAALLWIARL